METGEVVTCTSYLVDEPQFPYCKGCGHGQLIRALDAALVKLQLNPSDVDITTDIGCVGLADALFKSVHTVHTTHGRSTAFAVGTILADRILAEGKLKTVVLIGDGGAMIGLVHLVHAAQLNVDVTVILHNNLFFGMTGGQNSALSPLGFITTTTRRGNIVPPLDICQMMQSCGAGFVARKFATDHDLPEVISEAIAYPGFALVEAVELCTAFGPRLNELTGKRLKEVVAQQGWSTGVLVRREQRADFGQAYKEKYPRTEVQASDDSIPIRFQHTLTRPVGLVVSGSAGERVQSSARLFCQAAVMSGLYSTQKNDNPVTQGTGFSFSEVGISPEPILYTGIEQADGVIIVSEDGWQTLQGRRILDRLSPEAMVIIDSTLPQPQSAARCVSLPLRRLASGKLAAAAGLGLYLKLSGLFPLEAYQAAISETYGEQAADYLKAVDTVLNHPVSS